jgi:hypothetical protein
VGLEVLKVKWKNAYMPCGMLHNGLNGCMKCNGFLGFVTDENGQNFRMHFVGIEGNEGNRPRIRDT